MDSINNFFEHFKNILYNILVWCSAADRTILDLDECKKSEQIKQCAIGILLFITSFVAAVAGGYMFFLIFTSKLIAIIFGIIWGIIFFFIDRSVVSSIRKRENLFLKDFFLASPRIFLACLAAIFVSYGMDLKFFESDIDLEMATYSDSLIAENIKKNSNYLKANYDTDINNVKSEIKEAKENIPADLKIIIGDYNECKRKCDSLNRVVTTNNSYYYRQINSINSNYKEDEEKSEADAKKIKILNDWRTAYYRTLNNANKELAALNEKKQSTLERYQKSVESLEKKNNLLIDKILVAKDNVGGFFQNAEKDRAKLHKDNTKLSARIASLDRITDFSKHYTNWKTYWQIFLLFFAIELLPVLTKLFMWRGPYDFILEAKEYQIEAETKAKKLFVSSTEFANIFSFATKFDTQSKSQNERVRSIFKTSNEFIKNHSEEHSRFVKFIQKRFSEINKLDGEMDGTVKDKELKAIQSIIELFYKHSDKAFNEFNKS